MKNLRMEYSSPIVRVILLRQEDAIKTSGEKIMERNAQQDFFS
jgi:hypothetical protein